MLCVHVTTDSFTIYMIIPFPVLMSHIYFRFLLIQEYTIQNWINEVRGKINQLWLLAWQQLVWPWHFIPIFFVNLVRPNIKCISFVLEPNNEISICPICFWIYRRRSKLTPDYKLTSFAAWWGRRRVEHDVKEFYK